MLVPELARGDRRVADALIDELEIPRLADAEAIHRADFHVRHHLRRRNNDGLDVLVGIDAAGGEPVADPQIVGAAREGHRGLHGFAGRLLGRQRVFELRGVDADFDVGIFLGDRDALAVEIEPRQDVHRRRHAVLRHFAGADQIRHRRQDVRAVNAIRLATEHEIVARRAPRCLLGNLDVRHAVLGEEAFLLGDEQWRRVGERDEAERGFGDFRTVGECHRHAERKLRIDRAQQRGGARARFQE